MSTSVLLIEILLTPFIVTVYQTHNIQSADELREITAAGRELQVTASDPDLFYRTESADAFTFNDGALWGFHSASIFSSTANKNTNNFLISLGADGRDMNNRSAFGNGSAVSRLFLGIKYMTGNNTAINTPLYELVATGERNISLYRNIAYLPLGFLVEESMLDLTFTLENRDSFAFQNQLFSAATGIEDEVYTPIDPTDWQFATPKNTTATPKEPGQIIVNHTDSYDSFTVSATCQAPADGVLTLYLATWYPNTPYTVYRNGTQLYTGKIIDTQQMFTCGTVAAGDELRVEVTHPDQTWDQLPMTLQLDGAVLNEELFLQGFDKLNQHTLELTEFSNTRVAGTIHCKTDGLLYTSIPQNSNWTAYIDGKKANIALLEEAMICLELPEGTHTVQFRYRNNAFLIGCTISACSAAGLLICLYRKKSKSSHRKQSVEERSDAL